MMILKPDPKDMMLYRQHFGDCGNLEPNGGFCVDYKDKCYRAPKSETPEKFRQRLRRSIELGENLFVKEYEEFDPYPNKDADY